VLTSQNPDDFNITRSVNIKAEPKIVFDLVNDFKEWSKWSPYEAMDPELKKTYSGTDRGVGAVYEYDGKKVGAGRMEITDSKEPRQIKVDLDFISPMQAKNKAEFSFEKDGEFTKTTWSMTGKYNLMSKIASLVLNIDKMVGKDFETGLESIKKITEKA
jgi:carbon monoxide dehydrogenase subunit G